MSICRSVSHAHTHTAGKLLKEQSKDLPNVVKLFDPIVAKYKLLEKFEVDVDAAELAKLDSLESQYETFKSFLAATDKNLGACKRNMKADLDKAAASFQAEAQAMADFFKNEAPSSGEKISTAEALEQLSSLTERLEKNRATEQNLRNGMEIFDQTLEENACMTSVESGIALLNEMWGMKGEWETIWDGYKLGKFAELKTDSMEETAGKFMKKVTAHPLPRCLILLRKLKRDIRIQTPPFLLSRPPSCRLPLPLPLSLSF